MGLALGHVREQLMGGEMKSMLESRRQSLERLIEDAEKLLSGIEDHVEQYGETLLYDDDCDVTCEHSARHQLLGSVLFCLRRAKAREPRGA